MVEYDRPYTSEGIDINKINALKECDICHHWYFLDENFEYESYLCSGSHDLMQKAAIVSVKGNDYRIHFWYMSKNDAINIMKNSNLNEKSGSLQFFTYLIISETTYYQRNRDAILNRAKEYYKNDKEIMQD